MELGVLGSIAAFVVLAIVTEKLTGWWQHLESWLKRAWHSVREGRDAKRFDVLRVSAAIVGHYDRRGAGGALYGLKTVAGLDPLPLLHGQDESVVRQVGFRADDLVRVTSRAIQEGFPVNQKLVKTQLALGKRLTNDPVLYLAGAAGGCEPFDAGVVGYRATVTLADDVSRVLRGERRQSVAADDLTSFNVALQNLRPMVIASDTTCVFTDGSRQVVAIHRRSPKTVNAPGAFTVTPAYTYETNKVGDVSSQFGVVGYNFLREFLEEFFNVEDLETTSGQPRADPDWIFESPHGQRLIEEVDGGRVELWYTGAAIDVSHCCFTIALTARFTSPDFRRHVMKAARSNWEGEKSAPDRPAIDFPELFGPSMDEKLRGNMKPTTSFSIDGARHLLAAGS